MNFIISEILHKFLNQLLNIFPSFIRSPARIILLILLRWKIFFFVAAAIIAPVQSYFNQHQYKIGAQEVEAIITEKGGVTHENLFDTGKRRAVSFTYFIDGVQHIEEEYLIYSREFFSALIKGEKITILVPLPDSGLKKIYIKADLAGKLTRNLITQFIFFSACLAYFIIRAKYQSSFLAAYIALIIALASWSTTQYLMFQELQKNGVTISAEIIEKGISSQVSKAKKKKYEYFTLEYKIKNATYVLEKYFLYDRKLYNRLDEGDIVTLYMPNPNSWAYGLYLKESIENDHIRGVNNIFLLIIIYLIFYTIKRFYRKYRVNKYINKYHKFTSMARKVSGVVTEVRPKINPKNQNPRAYKVAYTYQDGKNNTQNGETTSLTTPSFLPNVGEEIDIYIRANHPTESMWCNAIQYLVRNEASQNVGFQQKKDKWRK